MALIITLQAYYNFSNDCVFSLSSAPPIPWLLVTCLCCFLGSNMWCVTMEIDLKLARVHFYGRVTDFYGLWPDTSTTGDANNPLSCATVPMCASAPAGSWRSVLKLFLVRNSNQPHQINYYGDKLSHRFVHAKMGFLLLPTGCPSSD